MQGKIIKGIAGFYYVQTEDKLYECKASYLKLLNVDHLYRENYLLGLLHFYVYPMY